jgi:omega-6 fatty acid desaturase (delta-12 desaturase)
LTTEHNVSPVPDRRAGARNWAQILLRYRQPSGTRSVFELIVTAVPFVLIWAAMWAVVYFGFWPVCFLLAIPAAGFLVRLFLIQHDCGHGSFFRQPLANDWVGRVLGVFTLTPYDVWRREHALHHATTGNLDRRGMGGEIRTLTVEEYLALPWLRRVQYRLYRNPFVMFALGPAFVFVLCQRLPLGAMRAGWRPWMSAMSTNVAIAIIVVAMMWLVGVGPFLMVHVPIMLLAATIGVWLFYVQHQFENVAWARSSHWDIHEAALHGSSYYDLPTVLRWFTANIGIHHIHHLNSRIPYYRLRQVLRDHPELGKVGRITLWQSLRLVRLSLWDEYQQRMISFREMRAAKSRQKELT